jgi:adenylate cyclase
MSSANQRPIQIDLDRFKLHLSLSGRCELSLHFDSPSRRFYLAVMAFVVSEMKKSGRMTSIPLGEHWELLSLLNETVGAGAGSSKRENLLPRIYRKWKDALPDLENAPLFKVLGKRKEFGEGVSKTYLFTDEEKDAWANLFEYKGSFENVRLRLSVDKLGATLNDVEIIYGESTDLSDDGAWERFVNDLQRVKEEELSNEMAPVYSNAEDTPEHGKQKGERKWWTPWRFVSVVLFIAVALAGLTLWKLSTGPDVEPASQEKMAFPLPDKPSIAVLPFVNMNTDPEGELFTNGLTEGIITALAKVPKLFVIGRDSTFSYKDKPVKVKKVSEDLGVQYVLEGSVQKAGERVRITAQLLDALKGHHLWAERYDRDLKDLFAIQDDITKQIITSLQVKLTDGEYARIVSKQTHDLDAYLKVLEALWYAGQSTRESVDRARQLAQEAIEMDPGFASAYSILGLAHMVDALGGFSRNPRESLEFSNKMLEKAIEMDGSQASTPALRGYTLAMLGRYDEAIAEAERAYDLAPNNQSVLYWYGTVLCVVGRPEEAISPLKEALRLNPVAPNAYFRSLGMAHIGVGRYEEAITYYRKATNREPDDLIAQLGLVSAGIRAGRDEEARAAAKEVLRINPKFSVERHTARQPMKDPAARERFVQILRKAGLPD